MPADEVLPVVRIEWDDAHDGGTEDWTPVSDVEAGLRRIVTVGLLLEDTGTELIVAQSLDETAQTVRHVFHIPWVCVTDMKYLLTKSG